MVGKGFPLVDFFFLFHYYDCGVLGWGIEDGCKLYLVGCKIY